MAQGQILNGQILLGLEEQQSGPDETYEHGEHPHQHDHADVISSRISLVTSLW
jgi:hypothetical protein